MPEKSPFIGLLEQYLGKGSQAYNWTLAYITFCHAVDDIIDGDKLDSEHILKTFEYTLHLYSDIFYLSNIHILYPLCKMVSNTYADSVSFSRSGEKWKKDCADILRHTANEVTLACVEIVGGYDKRREASAKFRELSFHSHHDRNGVPC